MELRVISIAALAVAISGCATLGQNTKPEIAPEVKASGPNLSPRKLAPQECGLFVWMADPERRFILFSQAQRNEAVWAAENSETPLQITSQEGDPRNGQFPRQSFTPIDLTLDLRQPQSIDAGTRYKGGTLTVKSPDVWDKIIPVVGLSVCQPG